MSKLDLTLSEPMHTFVRERARSDGHGTAGEYIRHLIREAQVRDADAGLEALLLEGLLAGEPILVTDDWWERRRSRLDASVDRHAEETSA